MSAVSQNSGSLPVSDDWLAGALRTLGVPLQTEMVGGTWRAISRVYSEKNKTRENGQIVPGRVTYYFATHTPDGLFRTKDLVQAWVNAGKIEAGKEPQGVGELAKIRHRLSHDDLTEETRERLAKELSFWEGIAWLEMYRISLRHVHEMRQGIMRDVPPYAMYRTPKYMARFKLMEKSEL